MIPPRLDARKAYQVVNLTRRTCVVAEARVALTFGARVRGLLGRRHLAPEEGLFFPRCAALHTWGMRMALDIVMVDRDGLVVFCAAAVPPWRCVGPIRGAWGCLEAAPGTIAASQTGLQDLLLMEPLP